MQIISEFGFSPRCISTLGIRNRGTIPSSAGVSCNPCSTPVGPSLRTTCNTACNISFTLPSVTDNLTVSYYGYPCTNGELNTMPATVLTVSGGGHWGDFASQGLYYFPACSAYVTSSSSSSISAAGGAFHVNVVCTITNTWSFTDFEGITTHFTAVFPSSSSSSSSSSSGFKPFLWILINWGMAYNGPDHYVVYCTPSWNTTTLNMEKVQQYGYALPAGAHSGAVSALSTDSTTWPDMLAVNLNGC